MSPDPLTPYSPQRLTALLTAARQARGILEKVTATLRPFTPRQITDSAGRGYLALVSERSTTSATGSGETGGEAAPSSSSPIPFSISVFHNEGDLERWLPAPSSALANNGILYFCPWDPVLLGTPISTLTPLTAPLVPEAGLAAYLEFNYQYIRQQGLPVIVSSVNVVTVSPPTDPAPDDSLDLSPGDALGRIHRPWFTLSARDASGARTLTYQTLGFCHFWLHAAVIHEDPGSGGSG